MVGLWLDIVLLTAMVVFAGKQATSNTINPKVWAAASAVWCALYFLETYKDSPDVLMFAFCYSAAALIIWLIFCPQKR